MAVEPIRTYSLECFFLNDPATTEIYTLSLHDALPILVVGVQVVAVALVVGWFATGNASAPDHGLQQIDRSEEHTSELQSRLHLVCRLLLEKKKTRQTTCELTSA